MKRVPPKSFVRSRSEKPKLFRSETRKDSAVHVSLSSSSLVKQPGTRRPQPSLGGRVPTPLPTMNELQSTYVDCCVTQQGEEHQWRVRSPWSVTRRRRAQWSGYRPHPSALSTAIVNKSSHSGSSEKIQRFQLIRRPWTRPAEPAPEKISKKVRAPGGLRGRFPAPLPDGPCRPPLEETFSIRGAVLEPQSRGVLIRDKLESRGCQWGLPAVFMGSEEGDLQMTRPSFDIRETSRDLFSA